MNSEHVPSQPASAKIDSSAASLEASSAAKPRDALNRRSFLQLAGAGVLATAVTRASAASSGGGAANAQANKIELPPIHAATEGKEAPPKPSAPHAEKVGFALVGLGHLTLEELVPAFAQCKYAKPVALVSGDRTKAQKLARQLEIHDEAIYNYETYDRLAENPEVKVIYIVLPNGMHAEYTVRGAKAGKHILCEKPMASTVAECEQMIAACESAKVKLMIAYRSQYEPFDRAIVKMVREKKFGALREFVSANSQNEGDPSQWRLNKKLAGGGPLPDVGIYAINAARFLSGEEPSEVMGFLTQPKDDPRFREVESAVQFTLKFPSGFLATATCSYNAHRSQFLRLQGDKAWAEMDPAYAYRGLRLRTSQVVEEHDAVIEPRVVEKNQFALEIDHMAQCVMNDRDPHTPGEEGLQDMRIIEAIYESARSGKKVSLMLPKKTRGPDLEDDAS